MTASTIPHYIKTLMLEEQVRQGNKADWSVFEILMIGADQEQGGFNWSESSQSGDIWIEALYGDNPEPLRQWCLKHRPELLETETITPSQAESIIFESTGRVVKIKY